VVRVLAARELAREVADQDRRHPQGLGPGHVVVERVAHEDHLLRCDASRLAERVPIDSRMRLAGARFLAGGDGVEVGTETDAFEERVKLVVVDVAHDAEVKAAPAQGGQMYELDVRSICHNLLATLTRREEAYHQKVRAGESAAHGDVASIHDRVVFKQEGLDKLLQVDRYPRRSLVDHFYTPDVSLPAVAAGDCAELGDFVAAPFEARMRRSPERMQVQLVREGRVGDHPIRITKGVTLEAGDDALVIAYLLEGLPQTEVLHFGVELNFSGLPAGADDRHFRDGAGQRLGQLGTRLDLVDVDALGLTDGWLGIDVDLKLDRPSGLWTYPVESVSQSEAGFELVHQSVVVNPHWLVEPDAEGRWSVQIRLAISTAAAESRRRVTEKIGVGV